METKEQNESKMKETKETAKAESEAVSKTTEAVPNPDAKKNKKLIYGIIAAIVVIGVCIVAYVFHEQQRKQQIFDSIKVTFVDDLTVEYGAKNIDFHTFIQDKTDDVIMPESIDTMKLGEIEVIYKVEKAGMTKEFPIKINVVDTQAPIIKIKEDTVTIAYGTEYDFKDNIESVKDPVDGDVPYSDKAGEYNCYTVEGKINSSKAGDYAIIIKAIDKNKNKTEKKFTVHVQEKAVEQLVNKPRGGNNDNTPPVNHSGSNATSAKPETCVPNGTWSSLGNSGYANYSYDAALDWGNKNCPDGYRAVISNVRDNCGNEGWSVQFVMRK